MNEKDTNQYSIDVIVPVYNGQEYLAEALSSIKNQTYPPKTIIIIDDGSTDGTRQIAQNFISKCQIPSKYFYINNSGPSAARNLGIRESNSKFIAFLDADDIWVSDKLEKQINIFKSNSNPRLGVVYCRYSFIDEKGKDIVGPRDVKNLKCYRGNIESRLRKKVINNDFLCGVLQILVPKSVIVEIGYLDEDLRYAEDWDLFIRLSKKYDFEFVDDVLLKVRDHGKNTTKNIKFVELNRMKFYAKNHELLKYDRKYIYNLYYFIFKNIKDPETINFINKIERTDRVRLFPLMNGNIRMTIIFYMPVWIAKSLFRRLWDFNVRVIHKLWYEISELVRGLRNFIHPIHINGSVIDYNGQLYIAARKNDRYITISKLILRSGTNEHIAVEERIINVSPSRPRKNLVTDPRLFIYDNKLYCAYTYEISPPKGSKQALAQILTDGKVISDKVFDYSDKTREKNWSFFGNDGELLAVYSVGPEHVVLNMDMKVRAISPGIIWEHGCARGGTPPIRIGNKYYAIFHAFVESEQMLASGIHKRKYSAGWYSFDTKYPFNIIESSRQPLSIIASINRLDHEVIFPCGLIEYNNNLLMSYGHNDKEVRIIELNHGFQPLSEGKKVIWKRSFFVEKIFGLSRLLNNWFRRCNNIVPVLVFSLKRKCIESSHSIIVKGGYFLKSFSIPKTDKTIGKFYRSHGYWELALTLCLMKIVKNKSNVIDVGANIGYFSSIIAKLLNSGGRLCVIEANSNIIGNLKTNLDLVLIDKKSEDVEYVIINKLAWNIDGEKIKFYSFDNLIGNSSVFIPNDELSKNNHESYKTIEVSTVSIDSVCENIGMEKVDLIRIDAEGSEAKVLQGAQRVIDRNPSIVIVCEFLSYLYINDSYSSDSLLTEISNLISKGFHVYQPYGLGNLKEISLKSLQQGYCGDLILRRPQV